MYSSSINRVIQEIKKLPSVGQHTAERFVIHWLKSGKKDVSELMIALKEFLEKVKSCEICANFDDSSPCFICTNPKRNKNIVCVVQHIPDLVALEETQEYDGVYHVLRGLVDPSDEESITKTKVEKLFERITNNKQGVKITEIILALNPDMSGETTMLYLQQELKKLQPTLKITRLARGLPMGSDLVYADHITLGNALKNRI
jgi:recombination protein RecR